MVRVWSGLGTKQLQCAGVWSIRRIYRTLINIPGTHCTWPGGYATVMADYKEQGNHFFSDKKYDQAISCYSKAIVSFVCMRVV